MTLHCNLGPVFSMMISADDIKRAFKREFPGDTVLCKLFVIVEMDGEKEEDAGNSWHVELFS